MNLDTNDEQTRRLANARLKRMRVISQRTARLLREGGPPIDHGDLLYDERGLPKQAEAARNTTLDDVLPVLSVGTWPKGLSLRREDMYEDRDQAQMSVDNEMPCSSQYEEGPGVTEEMYEYNTSTTGEARIHLVECGQANPKSTGSWNRDEPNWVGPFSAVEQVANHAGATGLEVRVAGCCKRKIDLQVGRGH